MRYDTRCPCSDCDHETNHNHTDEAEWYMVYDHVWEEALKHGPAQYLCIGCLEERLRRKLTFADFNDLIPVNFMPEHFSPSKRLQGRMAGLVFDEAAYRLKHGI